MLKILDCMYFYTVMLSTQYSIGAYQTFDVTRVEPIRVRHIQSIDIIVRHLRKTPFTSMYFHVARKIVLLLLVLLLLVNIFYCFWGHLKGK